MFYLLSSLQHVGALKVTILPAEAAAGHNRRTRATATKVAPRFRFEQAATLAKLGLNSSQELALANGKVAPRIHFESAAICTFGLRFQSPSSEMLTKDVQSCIIVKGAPISHLERLGLCPHFRRLRG